MPFSIVRPDTNFDFIGRRRIAYAISAALILIGIASLALRGGPKYGIDFSGGVTVQVKFQETVDLGALKGALGSSGLTDFVVQRFGQEEDNEYLVRISRMDLTTDQARETIEKGLAGELPGKSFTIQRQEMVGPKVGSDLRQKAIEALYYAILLIAIYISGRFEQRWMAAGMMAAGLAGGLYLLSLIGLPMAWLTIAAMGITMVLCWRLKLNYALGAIVALIHDVLVTVGVFSLLGKEFDLTIVAALLTIVGYSLNDTIIVFDRIRENIRGRISDSLARTINVSVNQTLSRTILTSGTTLLVVLCLFLFGGGVIHDFALALLVGIGVGTYSSVFVASPILLGFKPSPDKEEPAVAPA